MKRQKTHRYHGPEDLVDEGDGFGVLAEDHGGLDEVPFGIIACTVFSVQQILAHLKGRTSSTNQDLSTRIARLLDVSEDLVIRGPSTALE